MKDTLKLTNDINEVPRLGEWIDSLGDRLGLLPDKVFNLNLALEEAVVNVMNYAYPGQNHMPIYLTVDDNDGFLRFVLEDEGVPFDPTQTEAPDITLDADKRPIGGLGIFLVNQLMSKVSYEYKDKRNRLIMIG
ncbi:MAG: ATP-binding protein [Bacteroidaceae bacterium]|nr:ATP-binding protein [Bacteroidaceae bacterium]